MPDTSQSLKSDSAVRDYGTTAAGRTTGPVLAALWVSFSAAVPLLCGANTTSILSYVSDNLS